MAKPAPRFVSDPKHWIEQASFDLEAADAMSDADCESQRRYLYQQVCEKSLKAQVLASLNFEGMTEDAKRGVVQHILKQHSPLTSLAKLEKSTIQKEFGSNWPEVWRTLSTIERELQKAVSDTGNESILRRIEAAQQRLSAEFPSLRYPFFDYQQGEPTSPSRFGKWSDTLGKERDCIKSLKKLLRATHDLLRESRARSRPH